MYSSSRDCSPLEPAQVTYRAVFDVQSAQGLQLLKPLRVPYPTSFDIQLIQRLQPLKPIQLPIKLSSMCSASRVWQACQPGAASGPSRAGATASRMVHMDSISPISDTSAIIKFQFISRHFRTFQAARQDPRSAGHSARNLARLSPARPSARGALPPARSRTV
jgi:hypothetical protein